MSDKDLKEYEDNIKMMKTNRKILRELDLPQYKQNLDDTYIVQGIFSFTKINVPSHCNISTSEH